MRWVLLMNIVYWNSLSSALPVTRAGIWIGQDGREWGGGWKENFLVIHYCRKTLNKLHNKQNNIGLHSVCERRLKFDDFIKFRLKYARTRSEERARKLPAQLVYGLRGPPSTPLRPRNRSTIRIALRHTILGK